MIISTKNYYHQYFDSNNFTQVFSESIIKWFYYVWMAAWFGPFRVVTQLEYPVYEDVEVF